MKKKLVVLFTILAVFMAVGYGIVKIASNKDVKLNDKEVGQEFGQEADIKAGQETGQKAGKEANPITNQYLEKEEATQDNITIVTSFYPMYIATMNIVDGIDGVTLTNLTDNQTGCLHDYQLTTQDMRTLSTADVLILNGGDMELFLEESIDRHSDLYTVNASEGITFLAGSSHNHEHAHDEEEVDHTDDKVDHTDDKVDHSDDKVDHAEDESHHAEAINAHVWLNPDFYLVQIDNIATKLAQYDEKNAAKYYDNADAYKKKVKEVQQELVTKLADLKGVEVIAFHDAFAYLAEELGMEVVYTVHLDSDTSLSAGEIASVIDEVILHDIQYLFTEEQFSSSIASSIAAETNASVYVIDSLVTGNDDKDAYLKGMRANIETLKNTLTKAGE